VSEKQFDEEKFMELLREPSILDSETIPLADEGVLPKKEMK